MKSQVSIRTLERPDVPLVLSIIEGARREYGLEVRVAALLEPSDIALYETYSRERCQYFVAAQGDRVLGGAGIAPLGDSASQTCELQRMYLRPDMRGQGVGTALLAACLRVAKDLSFTHCYAETISEMSAALSFYEKHGFRKLDAPHGITGHGHNDCWLLRSLPLT